MIEEHRRPACCFLGGKQCNRESIANRIGWFSRRPRNTYIHLRVASLTDGSELVGLQDEARRFEDEGCRYASRPATQTPTGAAFVSYVMTKETLPSSSISYCQGIASPRPFRNFVRTCSLPLAHISRRIFPRCAPRFPSFSQLLAVHPVLSRPRPRYLSKLLLHLQSLRRGNLVRLVRFEPSLMAGFAEEAIENRSHPSAGSCHYIVVRNAKLRNRRDNILESPTANATKLFERSIAGVFFLLRLPHHASLFLPFIPLLAPRARFYGLPREVCPLVAFNKSRESFFGGRRRYVAVRSRPTFTILSSTTR